MSKPIFHDILQDRPVRVLFLSLIGYFSLVCALVVRGTVRLQQSPEPTKLVASVRPKPAGVSLAPHLLTSRELSLLHKINSSRSARFEQQELSSDTDAREAVDQIDEHLARWGQEYQEVKLDGNSTKARLEYVLNLPGQPELRGVVVAQRIKRKGGRKTLRQSLIANEHDFPALARELEPFGLRLR